MGIVRDLYMARKMSAGLKVPAPTLALLIKRLALAPSGGGTYGPADVVSFVTGVAKEVQSLLVSMQPIQSLNGYDHPWPAGGGVNRLPPAQEGSATNNGITVLSNGDGTYTVSGSTGSSSANITFDLPETYTIEDGDYFHFGNNVSNGSVVLNIDKPGGGNIFYGSSAPANRITSISSLAGQIVGRFRVYVAANQTNVTMIVKLMISKTSTYIDFAPYSNICPISGRTGLNVYVSPTQDQQDATTYAVDWTSEAGTVYGGSLDVVTGLLTVDRFGVLVDGSTVKAVSISNYGTLNRFGISYPSGRSPLYTGATSFCIADKLTPSYECTIAITQTRPEGFYVFPHSSALFISMPSAQYPTIASANDWFAANTPVVVYELATPLTYQLTPQEVETLKGENYVWSDAGPVTVKI